ncbi:hypothetical protein J2W40_002374 [Sphingobium xenophagum]|uniref:Uncharacterized protein n=1 Tax=Sphingobium xenophagum TaxID=121428 RepID=A0ABU1X329_SPHXE|nr:hypothetical protein [Sphingobium xenophagum]
MALPRRPAMDDAAASARGHAGRDQPGEAERVEQVDRIERVAVGIRHGVHRCGRSGDACIAHQNVDATGLGFGLVREMRERGGVADISGQRYRAERSGERVAGRGVDIGQYQPGTRASE